jgi:hypothetical protein
MALATRIKRLEESRGGGGPRCPDCGGGGPDEPDGGDAYELVLDEMPYDEPDTPDVCGTCGRQLSTTVYFPDQL